jgi:eukaryotic-like serine/threonine-protein kinase
MGFFTNLRSDRLITQIKSSNEPLGEETLKSVAKLKALGQGAIEPTILSLADADKNATVALVDVLSTLVSNKTFPLFIKGLCEGGPRISAGIGWALTSSRNYNPSLLLDALNVKGVSKSSLMDAIHAQRDRFNMRELLAAAYAQESNEKAALFRIIAEVADVNSVPELTSRLEGKDPIARMHIINILAKFNKPEIKRLLVGQLRDNNKMIRSAALSALARMDGPVDSAAVCHLLSDNEIDVQNRAIDVLIRANDPETIKHLIPVLKDENEYARRAAVEVLNEIGDAKSVKLLLGAIKDDDWWVRSRAGDALGKIGGPKVIDAVLELARDKDDDLRRAAIEILNQTKDERAVNHLIEATNDKDWWVSERAVDALAEIGNKRALPRLVEMLQTTPAKSLPVVVRAIGKLGEPKHVDALLPFLSRPEKELRIEAMQALAQLSDDNRAEQVKSQLQAQAQNADATIAGAAGAALKELTIRLTGDASGRTQIGGTRASGSSSGSSKGSGSSADSARPLPTEEAEIKPMLHQVEQSAPPKLDISTLRSGDIVEGRYKYIERIGKGAFGTVLLMEDTIVDDRLILKFLNPNVSEDEEMMKRFVHELRYSRKITHHNVIRIYDFLQVQGIYAISMEYFPSHTLGQEIVNEKPADIKKAVGWGIDMCNGMAVAHKVGIVHRDLKPANVLINNEGLLKIVDFGVAAAHREGDTQLTKTGYVIGSPKYMAPEQILGRKVDERADIYAVGVILYELLTGVPPYARGDHMAVMYQHVQGKARVPQELNPKLPPGMSDLIMKAMAVDKAKRFQSMDELRGALERFA